MKQLLNAITCNEPKRLIKPVFWNALANLSNLLPFLCLAYIVSQIYEYFVSGTLNRTSLWVAWGVMLAGRLYGVRRWADQAGGTHPQAAAGLSYEQKFRRNRKYHDE